MGGVSSGPKLIFLSATMMRGGAESQITHLASRLVARGYDASIVSMFDGNDYAEELRGAGVRAVSLAMERGHISARGVLSLVRLLRRERPDILHAHMFPAIMLARLCRTSIGPRGRLVETSHTPFEGPRLRYAAYRVSAGASDLWTNVCEEGLNAHVRAGAVRRSRARLVRNGVPHVPLELRRALRERGRTMLGLRDEFAWLAVGSFRDEAKDFGTLLSAFRKVRIEDSRARLFIAGDGPLRGGKERLAAELGLKEHVRFLGTRSDVSLLMASADAFVLSSAWEALPMVLLEAAAMGLAIVATDVGDVRSVIPAGAGRICAARNASSLAAAMLEVTRAPGPERARMGERARARIDEQFDLDAITTEWESIYRSVSEQAPSTTSRYWNDLFATVEDRIRRMRRAE